MSCPLLVLRPQPGAAETAARARALGLEAIVAPLFAVRPVAWAAADPAAYDAVMLTSANAARLGGEGLTSLLPLPCWTVGETTADAAAARGFTTIRSGPSDGAALLAAMADAGVRTALHLCGADHVALDHPMLRIERRTVYAAEATGNLPATAAAALDREVVVLLHSPRAARHFAALAGERRATIRLAAISDAAGRAAGPGWRSLDVAAAPRDAALLELAAKLCQTARD